MESRRSDQKRKASGLGRSGSARARLLVSRYLGTTEASGSPTRLASCVDSGPGRSGSVSPADCISFGKSCRMPLRPSHCAVLNSKQKTLAGHDATLSLQGGNGCSRNFLRGTGTPRTICTPNIANIILTRADRLKAEHEQILGYTEIFL
jgi:hypothetical protein